MANMVSYVLLEVIRGSKPTLKTVAIKSTVTRARQVILMSKAGGI